DEDHDHGDEDHDHGDEEHSDEEHDHSDEEKDEDHDHGDEDHDHGDEEHSDEEHSDEEHDHSDEEKDGDHDHGDDDHDHGDDHHHHHSGEDPHFFTDPVRMADAVNGIADFLQETLDFADPAAIEAGAEAYASELMALDGEVMAAVDGIPADNRVLVTSHEVFGYFADRYGFEVVGTVIPSGTTTDSASAGELAELAELIVAEGVPAIFSDTSSSDELAQTLAAEVGGDVSVVELFTESLGEDGSGGASYLEMVRTNIERMTAALA
ncbi:MAG: metal ABC transporter substrate-binding protein, partial [Actinomycetota bacterium]